MEPEGGGGSGAECSITEVYPWLFVFIILYFEADLCNLSGLAFNLLYS